MALEPWGTRLSEISRTIRTSPEVSPTSLTNLLRRAVRRELRLPTPEARWCAGDGRWHAGNDLSADAWLRLIRFKGGRFGPLLLAPGFSMSATSLVDDTTDSNLVEHLVARGYDVWLFDYRASIDLPSAHTQFTLDDIATHDWPSAVAEVLRMTGAETVQAIGHCVGSGSLMMALAAGLTGVRSAICMQFTLHPVSSRLNRAKIALKLHNVPRILGLQVVAPLTRTTPAGVLLDRMLRAIPMPGGERCDQPICHWINGVFGCTHTHDQLADATHEAFSNLFGVANMHALNHLALMVQRRTVVHSSGTNSYLAHPERLRLPILLVQGERNYIFHPEGSLRTLRWLEASNDPRLYTRVVLPRYAHLDALMGRDASRDVFPLLSSHLDRFNA